MSHDIQAPQDASADTQEILKELQAEGHDIAGQTLEVPKEEPKVIPPKEEKPEVKPEEKPEVKDAEKDLEPKEQKTERTVKAVPVGKYNDLRHEVQNLNKTIEELQKQVAAKPNDPTPPAKEQLDDVREAAKQFAEKHGVEPEFLAEFADVIVANVLKKNTLPKEVESQLKDFQAMKAQQESQALQQAQDAGFEKEFGDVLKEFPDLSARKDDIKQLAFTEGYERLPLRAIAIEYLHDNPIQGRKTAEAPSGGKSEPAEVVDFDNLTEDQFKNLSGKQLDDYLAHLERRKK